MSRVENEPAWVLHRRPWRESSLLIELFSHDHGRLAVVAKGARGARSAWRGLGEPFNPLRAGWLKRGEMGTLTALEPDGEQRRLPGRALWCGLYANELLIRLIGRESPCPTLFVNYTVLLDELAAGQPQAACLRRFEMALLDELGVVPDLCHEVLSGDAVLPDGRYHLEPESGVLPVASSTQSSVSGAALLMLAGVMVPQPAQSAEMRAVARRLIDHQLDGQTLKTRELFGGQRALI